MSQLGYHTPGELSRLTGAPQWLLRRAVDTLAASGVPVVRVANGLRLLPIASFDRLRAELERRGHRCPEVAARA